LQLLDEVVVTDSTHPLFGRRFPVISISRQPHTTAVVLVAYRDTMRLRIPITSTSLALKRARPHSTKWTKEAVQELLSLITEGASSCQKPKKSGRGSHKR
jgi:hypothetical protein